MSLAPRPRAPLGLLLSAALLAGCSIDGPLSTPAPRNVAPLMPAPGATSLARPFAEAPPVGGEVRQGYVVGPTGKTMRVHYEVHEGLALWQGDIVLGKAGDISPTPEGAKPFMRMDDRLSTVARPEGGTYRGVIIDGGGFRWPGGVVPYEVDPALPNQQRITDAIRMLEDNTGGVTLVPRNGQADYIRFMNSTVCNSPIGRQGGQQVINLASGCPAGSVAHEVMHSLGIFHEQGRCDRDTFVDIQWGNIEDGRENNFDMHCDDGTDIADYDFGSVMHYPLDAFSTNGQPTIKLRPGITYSGTIGQRDSLSYGDVFVINFMYGLNNQPPVPVIAPWTTTYYEGDAIPMDASGTTDPDDVFRTFRWNFGDNSCGGLPEPPECGQEKGTHKYFQDNVYKVGLFVFDGYELEATEAFVTVHNYVPRVACCAPRTMDEGDRYAENRFFLDYGHDYWSGTVDYGDGSGKQALALTAGQAFTVDHTYVDNGSFTVRVEVTDDDDTGVGTGTMTVRNANPVVDAGADQVLESGQSFNLAASFTDKGIADSPWNWSINWGDGGNSSGSTNTQGPITGSRQLCAAGTYNVAVTVTDKDGGVGSDATEVSVSYVVVGLDNTPGNTPNAVSLKNKGNFPVALLSSATFDATTVDLASVRLGDETGVDTPIALQKGSYQAKVQDVNGDGRMDLVLMFSVPALVANGDLTLGSTELVIRGFQGSGGGSCVNFRGSDAVKVVS